MEIPVAQVVRTIRGKLVIAFLALAGLGAAGGAYSISSVRSAAEMVVETYDKPLMSISYARAAMYDFAIMERTLHKYDARRHYDGAREALDAELATLHHGIEGNMDVARERALSKEARTLIFEAINNVSDWHHAALLYWDDPTEATMAALDAEARSTAGRIERLIDVMAADGFRFRESAIQATDRLVFINAGILILQIAAALLIGYMLGVRIVRPLNYAIEVAALIARGKLDMSIRHFGSHETVTLLRALNIMRKNLRSTLEREVALRESAQGRLAQAIEQIDDGVVLVNAEGRIAAANRRMAEFFPGAFERFAPGRLMRDAVAAAGLNALPAAAEALIGQGDAASAVPARIGAEIRIADGRWLRVSANRTPTRELISVWSDITSLKEREDAMRKAREEAEQANRAKSAFLANISHELRTPLNVIIGFSEIIEQEMMGPIGDPIYKEYAGNITEGGRNLLATINDLIDLSRAEAGVLIVTPTPVEIGGVIESCSRSVRKACDNHEHGLHVRIAPDVAPINADPQRLKQVLLNLLSNAIKFTPRGGRIDIEARSASDGAVEIVVRDNGIGMTAENISLALQPFHQVDSDLNRRQNGIGLGLPLSKALVELLGGRMDIASASEKGTAITLRFPALPPDAQGPASRAAA